MNREQTIEAIKVMQCFIDGGKVRNKSTGITLQKDSCPRWNWASEGYEIVPEPIERWLGIMKNGYLFEGHFSTEELCTEYYKNCATFHKAVKLIEEQ